jgi:beta-aspartyl-peptidase (threonine type)
VVTSRSAHGRGCARAAAAALTRAARCTMVSSDNGAAALPVGLRILDGGGSALDAVEACARMVEADLSEHSVGRGGLPNVLGEVRLDAQIMDGSTLRAGSVGAVRNCCHVITLARRVMDYTPHVMLVGDGAERLARELGIADAATPTTATSSTAPATSSSAAGAAAGAPLLTADAAAQWRRALEQQWPGLDTHSPTAKWRESQDPQLPPLRRWAEILRPRPVLPDHWFGTVNFMAVDQHGALATAVSTSGWGWSYPGRLGDSPVIGAGGYADSRYGACACTGTGEVAIRTAASRSVVLYMKMGMGVREAVKEAVSDLLDLRDPYSAHINIIALDKDGQHAGCSFRPEKMYAVMRSGEAAAAMCPHHNPHPWHTGEVGWLQCECADILVPSSTRRELLHPRCGLAIFCHYSTAYCLIFSREGTCGCGLPDKHQRQTDDVNKQARL